MKKLKGGNKMEKSVLITLIIVIGAVLIFGMSGNITEGTTISSNGQGSVKISPDQVRVYLNIVSKGDTAQSAENQNSEILRSLKESFKDKGLDESLIKTQSFSVYPEYDWINGKRVDRGFMASHSIYFLLDEEEFDKVGLVLDASSESEVEVASVSFELSDSKRSEAKAEAIKIAAEDAKIKAKAVAEGFDKKLGSLISTEMNDYGYYPYIAYSEAYDSTKEFRDSFDNFVPSEQEVSATVTARFKLR